MAIFRTQLRVTIISSKGAVVFQLCVGVHSVPTKNYSYIIFMYIRFGYSVMDFSFLKYAITDFLFVIA